MGSYIILILAMTSLILGWKSTKKKTLIIIGIFFWCVVCLLFIPRAWKHRYQAIHGIQRMNCSELAAYAQEWAEKAMLEQDHDSTAQPVNYIATLAGSHGGIIDSNFNYVQWIADPNNNNWKADSPTSTGVSVIGRNVNGNKNDIPKNTVKSVIPPDKIPWNPFDALLWDYSGLRDNFLINNSSHTDVLSGHVIKKGKNVFDISFFPENDVKVGAIACAGIIDKYNGEKWIYFSMLYQGGDSTEFISSGKIKTGTNTTQSFHAGQDANDIQGLRNGVFLGRYKIDNFHEDIKKK